MSCSCGSLTYKPMNRKTCCPSYTIKCDAMHFKISRAQKRVLTSVNTFLNTGEKPKEKKHLAEKTGAGATGDVPNTKPKLHINIARDKPNASGDDCSQKLTTGPKNPQRSGSSKRRRWKLKQEHMAKRAEDSGVPIEALKRVC